MHAIRADDILVNPEIAQTTHSYLMDHLISLLYSHKHKRNVSVSKKHRKQKMSKKGKKKEHSSFSASSESSTNTDSDLSDSSHVIPNRSSNTMSHFGDYLEGVYDRYKVKADDNLNISPSSEFIDLAVVHKDISNQNDKKSHININGIVVPEEKFVLVEGLPGVGKSTLCWELCRKWKTFKSLQKYEIVLLLKLRERRVQNSTSLEDIFYHEDKKLCKKVVAEVRKREGEGILLVMDGFDEMPPEVVSDQNRFIMKLIDGTCLPRATRLVSSRPSSLHNKKSFPQQYRHIKILGFTDESKVKFAESAFQSEPDVLDHFKKFFFSNPVINSLMYLPVNCAIIAQVYKDIRSMGQDVMPKTMTQLYTTLIRVLIRRHLIKYERWDENSRFPRDLKHLPKDIYADLQRLSELARKGLFKNQLVFTDDDDVIAESFHHLGLMNEVKEMYVCEGARTSYFFLHLSIQEFLAAWHVSIHPELSHMVRSSIFYYECAGYYKIHPLFLMFVRFLFGIIGPNTSKINILLNVRMAILSDVHCLYEAQNPEIISTFIPPASYLYRVNDPLDLYAFGYILVHSPISWEVDIATSLDMLVSSLKDHASSDHEILGSISKLALYSEFREHSELNNLPSCVTEHMTTIYVSAILNSSIPVFSEWILTLSDLNDIVLMYKEPCEEDYLLYQSLQSFTKLTILNISCFGCSSRGAQELSKVIVNSSTLEKVSLSYTKPHLSSVFSMDSVVEAVLLSSNVRALMTNFPFQISSRTKVHKIHSTSITIKMQCTHSLEMQRWCACLRFLAYLSTRVTPLEFGVRYSTLLQLSTLSDFITILNNSLHSTTRIIKSSFGSVLRYSSSCRSSFSRALKRDVSVPLSSLRRSQSLDDLSTSPHSCEYYQSCPDLLEMQSLHNMHPQLHENLRCDKLYYYKQHDSDSIEIKLKKGNKVNQRYEQADFFLKQFNIN